MILNKKPFYGNVKVPFKGFPRRKDNIWEKI